MYTNTAQLFDAQKHCVAFLCTQTLCSFLMHSVSVQLFDAQTRAGKVCRYGGAGRNLSCSIAPG